MPTDLNGEYMDMYVKISWVLSATNLVYIVIAGDFNRRAVSSF